MHLLVKEYLTELGKAGHIEIWRTACAKFVEWTFDYRDGPGAQLRSCDPRKGGQRLGQAQLILLWDLPNFLRAAQCVSEVTRCILTCFWLILLPSRFPSCYCCRRSFVLQV